MSRLGETFGQVLDEAADALERREAAGLARYLQLQQLLGKKDKLTVAQLRALGYFEGEELLITAQMTTWQERATQFEAGISGGFGPISIHAGFAHQSASGSRDYVTIQARVRRVIRTEGMQDALDALPPLPPLPTDGSLTLPAPVPVTPTTPPVPAVPDPPQPPDTPGATLVPNG